MQEKFVDSTIATKFGEFKIRVYAAPKGDETLVLWKGNFDGSDAVLVRVHSECLTGDVAGSLQCDCGKQLEKSLKLIGSEGGIFIYLRQEGRGIGLFEKIKTYQYQKIGFDTFEANILLGHKPDERTYEMVKTILDDLKIEKIRLLTNNPDKIFQISKLGIKVVDRVPLIVKSNKYNRLYFATKIAKFNHIFKNISPNYFYQFHAETPTHVKKIAEFIQDIKLDPLLKIGVGITASSISLSNEAEIEKIKNIAEMCQYYPELMPILHYSFRDSQNVLRDLDRIKSVIPYINRLQMNDLHEIKFTYLKEATKLFLVDLPLCDENFAVIHKKRIHKLLKRKKAFVLLDNSKGRGIQESLESLMKKIDILLSYGISKIGICGGFGPNALNSYFELRKFYRINFSIDAESKLKTNSQVDIEKTKQYLSQLLNFDYHVPPDQEKVKLTEEMAKGAV